MPLEPPQYPSIDDPIPDYHRVLIAFSKRELPVPRILGNLQEYGPRLYVEFALENLYVAAFDLANPEFDSAIAQLHTNFVGVRFERDQRLGLLQTTTTSDPYFVQQWALTKIEAPSAWGCVGTPTSPVVVAVIDSGAKQDHEDFPSASQLKGLNILRPNSTDFSDDDGHGTMVLGTIAAVSGNNLGVASVANMPSGVVLPQLTMWAIKFNSVLRPPTVLSAALGIFMALLHSAKVINLSWHVLDQRGLLFAIIESAPEALFVVAAGNEGANNDHPPRSYPASYRLDNVISVMASNRHDEKPGFSNYGGNVHIAAPGTGIVTTGIYYTGSARYPEYSGTSAAAAYVTGAAALLLAKGGTWSPLQIRQHLIASADPVAPLRGLCEANGRLNVHRAVCGPFVFFGPPALRRQAGTQILIQWRLQYVAPGIRTVEILIIDHPNAREEFLTQEEIPVTNLLCEATLPATAMQNVVIRVRCREMPNFYAESAPFDILAAEEPSGSESGN